MVVRTGVIGVGVMGAAHARLLSGSVSGSVLAAVFDVDSARAASVADACGARVFDDPSVLIKDPDVDAVLIASSDATHEQFLLAALAAGKPALCEKPLAQDGPACARILAAESAAGQRLTSVGYMRRYDTGYLDLRAAVRSGEVGPPLLAHCVHRNAGSGAASSAQIITGSAVHEIDILRWLLDDEVATVTVFRPRPAAAAGGTQDPVVLVLGMAGGVVADIEVFTTAAYGYEVRCELVAERGTVLLDAPAATVTRHAGSAGRALPADWRPRFAEAYRRELQDWVDGTAAGEPARGASVWDGLVATAVADAAVDALNTATPQVVRLPERPALYR